MVRRVSNVYWAPKVVGVKHWFLFTMTAVPKILYFIIFGWITGF